MRGSPRQGGWHRAGGPLSGGTLKGSQQSSHARWSGAAPRGATSDDTVTESLMFPAGGRDPAPMSTSSTVEQVLYFLGTGTYPENPEAWVRILRIFTWVGFLAAAIPRALRPQGAHLVPRFDYFGFSRLCGLVFALDFQRLLLWAQIPADRRRAGHLNQPVLFPLIGIGRAKRWRDGRR